MENSDSERIVSLEELPDDPLKMPPPYWRSNGAIFHIVDSLESIVDLLGELIPVHTQTEKQLEAYFEKYPEFDEHNETALSAFSDITDELTEYEHKYLSVNPIRRGGSETRPHNQNRFMDRL